MHEVIGSVTMFAARSGGARVDAWLSRRCGGRKGVHMFTEASVVFLVLSLTVLPVLSLFAFKVIDEKREAY